MLLTMDAVKASQMQHLRQHVTQTKNRSSTNFLKITFLLYYLFGNLEQRNNDFMLKSYHTQTAFLLLLSTLSQSLKIHRYCLKCLYVVKCSHFTLFTQQTFL